MRARAGLHRPSSAMTAAPSYRWQQDLMPSSCSASRSRSSGGAAQSETFRRHKYRDREHQKQGRNGSNRRIDLGPEVIEHPQRQGVPAPPPMKITMMISSHDAMNAKRAAANRLGRRMGNVTCQKVQLT